MQLQGFGDALLSMEVQNTLNEAHQLADRADAAISKAPMMDAATKADASTAITNFRAGIQRLQFELAGKPFSPAAAKMARDLSDSVRAIVALTAAVEAATNLLVAVEQLAADRAAQRPALKS